MNKKLSMIVLIFLFIILNVSALNCPTQREFLNAVRHSAWDFLENLEESDASIEEVKELLFFYLLRANNWLEANCSQSGDYLITKNITEVYEGIKNRYELVCNEDSDCGTVGSIGNYYCKNGNVYRRHIEYTCLNPGETTSHCISNLSSVLRDECEAEEQCIEGQSECQGLNCEGEVPYGECSTIKPKYCDNGNLINNCTYCGCDQGLNCIGNSCVVFEREMCSDCGIGFFNICDRQECNAILAGCYFIDGLFINRCENCTEAESCEVYEDETSCSTNNCNFENCMWNDTCQEYEPYIFDVEIEILTSTNEYGFWEQVRLETNNTS